MKKRTRAETREMIVDLWEKGYSIIDIRDEMGYKCSESIENQLRLAGINTKGESGLDVPKVLALMKAKWSMDKIVEEFNYDYSAEEIKTAIANEAERRGINGKTKEARGYAG